MCVSISRPTPPASRAAWAAWLPVDAHGGITAVDEGSVGKHEVGAREQRRQGRAGVGVAAVGQHAAGSLDAEAVRLDRVVDPERRHGERAEGERLLLDERGEDELARHAAVVETVVRERQPFLRPGRRVDRQGAGQGASGRYFRVT